MIEQTLFHFFFFLFNFLGVFLAFMEKNNYGTRQARVNSQETFYRPNFLLKSQNPSHMKDKFRNKSLSYNIKQGDISRVISNQTSPVATKYCFNVSTKNQASSFISHSERSSLKSPRKRIADNKKEDSSLPFLYGHLNEYNVKTHYIDLFLRVSEKTVRYRDYLYSYSAIALDLYKRNLIPLISLDYYTKQITCYVSPKIRKLDSQGELFWSEPNEVKLKNSN